MKLKIQVVNQLTILGSILLFSAFIVPDSGRSERNYVNQHKGQVLSSRHQNIVLIAAHTAKGNLEALSGALHAALDSGVTVNEIKEEFVHLSAYCGFPRSLNGINTFISVADQRKARGINDKQGPATTSLQPDTDKYRVGKENLERLTGRNESAPKTGYAAFVPVIDTFLKEHLFADIFSRGVLSDKDREVITVAALSSMGLVEAQLRSHLTILLNLGFEESQLEHLISIIVENGIYEAREARTVLSTLIKSRSK